MLNLKDITKTYQGRNSQVVALQGVSLNLGKGEVAVLRGPSGCGKTTLLLTAGGLLAPDSGSVSIVNQNLYAINPKKRDALRAAYIGFVFQQFHLLTYLNVVDNLLISTLVSNEQPPANMEQRAAELLEQFGLTNRAHHFPEELSTGERQRTALARAMMNRPALLLADEPTGNLDSENARLVMDAMQVYAEAGNSVLIVSHDDRVASRGNQLWSMESGRIS